MLEILICMYLLGYALLLGMTIACFEEIKILNIITSIIIALFSWVGIGFFIGDYLMEKQGKIKED